MSAHQDLLDRRTAVVPRGIPLVTNATVASANGALLTDIEGRELIDFAGGIGVMNAGHCQETSGRRFTSRHRSCCTPAFTSRRMNPTLRCVRKLASLLPHGDATKVMLVNSGAEAVENAVKIARQATGRPAVICFTEGFHGRTMMGMSLTSKVGYKTGCGPFAPGDLSAAVSKSITGTAMG